VSHQENAMSPARNPGPNAADDDRPEGQAPPVPDEDGPHDVPDDAVIEKTLPAGPLPGSRDGRPG
jgi:hypothetical protein